MNDKNDLKVIEELTSALQVVLHKVVLAPNEQRSLEQAFVKGADRLQWTRKLYDWERENG